MCVYANKEGRSVPRSFSLRKNGKKQGISVLFSTLLAAENVTLISIMGLRALSYQHQLFISVKEASDWILVMATVALLSICKQWHPTMWSKCVYERFVGGGKGRTLHSSLFTTMFLPLPEQFVGRHIVSLSCFTHGMLITMSESFN